MTEAQKPIADAVINYFKKGNGGVIARSTVVNDLQSISNNRELGYIINLFLYKDILHAADGINRENLFLTDKGWIYETYDKLLEQELYKRDLESRQMQSVIDTNKSVEATNRFQKLALILTSLFSLLTLVVSVLDLWKEEQIKINVAPSPVVIQQHLKAPSKDTLQRSRQDSLKGR